MMNDEKFELTISDLAGSGTYYADIADELRARDTAQREALAQLQAELPDLHANMTKALDLLQVLTSTKYTDRAFVEAVDDADEMLAQLRGKVVLKGQAEQQEAQGAQAGEFQREDRYIVIKRKDLEAAPFADRDRFTAALFLLAEHLPEREYLVIESDWPEYEPTWAAIQARVTCQGGDERSHFEKWFFETNNISLDEYPHWNARDELGEYRSGVVDVAWGLWRARAALATLPAAEPVAEAWMPMETAPKDRRILVLRRQNTLQMPSYAAIAKWNAQPHHSNPKPYWDIEGLGLYVKEMRDNPPLGWMPLPQPALRGAEHE